MIARFNLDSLKELASVEQRPSLSLYQPTYRHHPDNLQDPIRFRNLVSQAEASLRQTYPDLEVRRVLEPFEALTQNKDFWNHTLDGLAVLGGPDFFRVFTLPRAVTELVVVADSFHTKPLRRFLQSVDRYQVLGLSLGKVRLFEGNRHVLDEIDLAPKVPRSITQALGEDLTEPHQNVSSHGGVGQGRQTMHHTMGGKKDESDLDAEKFFRAIDRAVLEHHSRPSGLPLILASLPEHHHRFHAVSHNPFLLGDCVSVNPDSIAVEDLRLLVWQLVEPQYHARLAALSEAFEQARAKKRGSAELDEIAVAAVNGRIERLLIEADRQLPGRLDSATGRIKIAALSDPGVDDLLDDLGDVVEKSGGEVVVVPAERMPGLTGLAATYRY